MESHVSKKLRGYFIVNFQLKKEKRSMKNINMNMSKEVAEKVNTGVAYELTPEMREELRTEMKDLLVEYDFNPTDEAIDIILNVWRYRKANIIRMFEQSPFYNGKFQIVFPSDYRRDIDYKEVKEFLANFYSWVSCEMLRQEKEYKNSAFTYAEARDYLENIQRKLDVIEDVQRLKIAINVMDVERSLKEMYEYYKELMLNYKDKVREGNYVFWNDKVVLKSAYQKSDKYGNMLYWMATHNKELTKFTDDEVVRVAKIYVPELNVVTGQKISRFVTRLATETGYDKTAGYLQKFTKFADAINPLNVTKWTVISCHPVDYYTMSFGNSWSSCQTIDRNNKRNRCTSGTTYHGMCMGGTGSYMEDSSTFICYVVDKSYEGKNYELQDKIQRCLFMIGEGKLIQSRMYPQATDGATDKYLETREIVQSAIAQCLGVPNLWFKTKDSDDANNATFQTGVHYNDLQAFSSKGICLNYLKDENGNYDTKAPRIRVGSVAHCPSCGKPHTTRDDIRCEECASGRESRIANARSYTSKYAELVATELEDYENGDYGTGNRVCVACGEIHDVDDMHEIGGDWYCEDCCFYCEYHEEWETGDSTHVMDYGDVCDDAIAYGDFRYCDNCNEYYYISDDTIETDDDHNFCCARCAERYGYVETVNDGWHDRDDVRRCEHCDDWYYVDDYNPGIEIDDEWFCDEDCAIEHGYVQTEHDGWQDEDDCVQDFVDGIWELASEVSNYDWVYVRARDAWTMNVAWLADNGFVDTEDDGWRLKDNCIEVHNVNTGDVLYYATETTLRADGGFCTAEGWRIGAVA